MREISVDDLAANVNNPSFGDDTLGVVFYKRTVEDISRSAEVGHRCFKDAVYVKIMTPGDRHNVTDRRVQRTGILPTDDALRFPKQWARFMNNQTQEAHDGTPLALWNVIPAPLAEELKHINIFTVEQLANLSDTFVAKIHGGVGWKQKAGEFVRALKDTATVGKLQSELAARDNEIDTLKKAMADQTEKMEAMGRRLAKLEK